MYLDLMDVLRSPGAAIERKIAIPPTTLDDVELVAPVEGEIRATNARQNIVVSGRAHTEVKLECARCLESYAQPLDLELEASAPLSYFRTRLGEQKEDENGEDPDDEMVAIFDSHTVDVLELIRQAVVLQAPLKPLCSPDCAGLPEAEKYRETDDERWEALRNWANDKENPTDN
jgi:uncharacterized protein